MAKTPEDVVRAITDLTRTRVYVGIPSEAGERDTGGINNATLGYIHEMGSPARNIPSRPFLAPGVANSRPEWEKYLRQAADAAFEGQEGAMKRAFEAAGTVAADAVKQVIVDKIPPPIKPASMAARRRHRLNLMMSKRERTKRTRARGAYAGFYERYEHGIESLNTSGVTPLIDTSQLISSITYVVRKG